MAVRLEAVAFDVTDPPAVAGFWAGLLDRTSVPEPGGALVPGDLTQIGLRFVTSRAERTTRPRLHLHLTSVDPADQQRIVDTALELGGRHLDVGQRPDETFVVLADPGDGEFCVIEAGNAFLAGTGLLGEVTCGGTRAAGLFWRDALGWPLVWDEGDQTAIQSPLGGTKISWDAWDEPTAGRHDQQTRQRFDLVSSDPTGQAERLVSLGATVRSEQADHLELADPDGNAFSLRAG